MKKTLTALSLILGLTLAASAFAGGYAKHKGGLKQDMSQMPVSTVKAAQNMPDETMVMMQGNITKRVKKDKYMFNDNTGEIMVEIDGYAWNGQDVAPTDMVTIVGEIDKDGNMTIVEVDEVMLPEAHNMQ
ncbi:MAG: NirD/YgiW/YdeI family stress tolerance protein [Alphaproteobacteria bacterium]|nr:NirD/YgiW/YdeI family stress tolerance protein [Alphaproteobacteria bacterium]